MYNDFCGNRYYYNPYYPYNTLEEKCKFLEAYKECVDVLVAINSVFPENEGKIFNLISKLYVEPIGNKNIIVRYNGIDIKKDAISGSTNVRYELAINYQLEKEWLGDHYDQPRPKLKDVRLNIFDSKEIIFEIETKKGDK